MPSKAGDRRMYWHGLPRLRLGPQYILQTPASLALSLKETACSDALHHYINMLKLEFSEPLVVEKPIEVQV